MKQRNIHSLQRICAFFLSLTLLASLTGCGKFSRQTKEIEATVLGIDVARYQGTIDWQQVADSGIGFAMVRLGYRGISTGEISEDLNARYNLQEASRAGIPMGAYFFSTAISAEEAEEEARWSAELLAKYPITYPVVYDCEGFRDPDSRQFHMTSKERTDVALVFLETIEELGYEAMFYSSKNEMNQFWEMERIQEKYKVWVAQYPAEPYPQTPQSSYEGQHQMWQYTKEGSVPGIDQPVDMNVAYFGYDGIEPAKDSAAPEEAEPHAEAMMTFTQVDEQVTAKEETNLRSIPSQDVDSVVLDTLYNGEYAQRIAVSANGWSKVVFEGNTYYALSNYLTTGEETTPSEPTAQEDPDGDGIKTQFTPVSTLVTAKDVVNLRKLPSATREDATVLFQLKNGEVATCVGVSDNGWSKLEYKGETCYAVSSYLMEAYEALSVEQVDEADVGMAFKEVNDHVTPKKEVNLRTRPTTDNNESEVVVKISNGEVVARTGINREMGWSRVVYYGTVLYCSTGLLTEVVK